MKSTTSRLLAHTAFSVVLFMACLLFWLVGHPELMSYHEQYQLFLFTGDYFGERVALPGGIADYVSEFIVQFYYVSWAGATLIALVMVAIQILLAACCFKGGVSDSMKVSVYALAAIPPILLTYFMGDINLLMSYPVAIMLMLLFSWFTLALDIKSRIIKALTLFGAFIALYWCAGPVALLYPVLVYIIGNGIRCGWLWAAGAFVVSGLIIFALNRCFFTQYPETQLFFGINYYRITNLHPSSIFVTAASLLVIAFVTKALCNVNRPIPAASGWIVMAATALIAIILVPKGYNGEEMEILRYDVLVRNEKWHDIISMAEKKAPVNDFCLQGLNLALAKTGQLSDRMFEFDQQGIGSLISKYKYDNTSCLISAEIFYHLGMINSAFRYNFDIQEATMNDRKSGRFMKRMAECMIINHQYDIAAKYINMLKNSLFYSTWAKRAEAYYKDSDKTDQMPLWAQKRQLRYKQEMLYDYEEIEKMFGLLALGSEGRNLLAWDYFNAALLLKGDLQTMTGMYHYAKEQFNLPTIPKHHQEAIGMYWTFGHPSFDGLPYPISDEVKNDIANLAQAVSRNPSNPDAWAQQFAGNYCVYFLRNQLQTQTQQSTATTAKGSEREG